MGSTFFSIRADPCLERRKNSFHIVSSPESVSITFNSFGAKFRSSVVFFFFVFFFVCFLFCFVLFCLFF